MFANEMKIDMESVRNARWINSFPVRFVLMVDNFEDDDEGIFTAIYILTKESNESQFSMA